MADYKLTNTNVVNSTSTKIYLIDDTEYATDERSKVAILILGVLKHSKGNKVITFDSYDPLTASSFNANIGVDGWYQISMASLEIYDPLLLSSYPLGNIYYSVNDNSPIQISIKKNVKYATKIDTSMLIGSKYVVSTIDTISVAINTKIMLRLNGYVSDLITNNVDFKDKRLIRLKDNYNIVRVIVQGSIYEFARGNKSVSEKNLEFLNSNDYTRV